MGTEQGSGIRDQGSGVRDQEAGVRRQRPKPAPNDNEPRTQNLELRTNPEPRTSNPEPRTNPEARTQNLEPELAVPPSVLVTRRLPSSVLARLESGYQVDLWTAKEAIPREELLARIAAEVASAAA